jgi:hypothetical protein
MAQLVESAIWPGERGMVFGLAAGGFAAAVLGIAVAMAELRYHTWTVALLFAMGIWGWIAVQDLLSRYRRYRRILLEHGLLPNS